MTDWNQEACKAAKLGGGDDHFHEWIGTMAWKGKIALFVNLGWDKRGQRMPDLVRERLDVEVLGFGHALNNEGGQPYSWAMILDTVDDAPELIDRTWDAWAIATGTTSGDPLHRVQKHVQAPPLHESSGDL